MRPDGTIDIGGRFKHRRSPTWTVAVRIVGEGHAIGRRHWVIVKDRYGRRSYAPLDLLEPF